MINLLNTELIDNIIHGISRYQLNILVTVIIHDTRLTWFGYFDPGLRGDKLNTGLRRLRNLCLICLLLLNTLWLVLLSLLYYNTDMNLAKLNIYGLIAGAVYGLVLFIQLVGMTVHRIQALFARFGRAVFGDCKPVWIYRRDRNSWWRPPCRISVYIVDILRIQRLFWHSTRTGVIGSNVPWLDCPSSNAITWVITVTE